MSSIHSSTGPVVVTGASGFVGAHVVRTLLERGYTVRACVTDPDNLAKTDHLLAMNEKEAGQAGELTLHKGNVFEEGSYDAPLEGCAGLLHVGTAMGYARANQPQEIYDAAVGGTQNVVRSVARAGTIKRIVYTSSFAAVGHPAPTGYVFTEDDWASDNREDDPNWNVEGLNEKGETGYEIGKVETELLLYRLAEEDGSFDAMSINPIVVLGPLLAKVHELAFSWQWALGRMLRGKPCIRGWQHLWNIVDVRDVAMAHVLALESDVAKNGDRYILAATDESGEIDVMQLQAHLQALFPNIDVGGAPDEIQPMLEKHGHVFDAPRAHCDKARRDLGLETHDILDTLRETGQTTMDLGIIEPKLK